MTTHNNKDFHKSLTKKEKGMLWSRIAKTAGIEERRATFGLFRFKVVLVTFLIVVFVTSSAVTVSAANNAVPGDILFPLDIAVEKIQLVFSKGHKKNTLRITFAEERLEEVQSALVASGIEIINRDTKQSKNIHKAEKALFVALKHLEKVKKNLEKGGNSDALVIIDDIIEELHLIAGVHVQNLVALEQLEQSSTSTHNGNNKNTFTLVAKTSSQAVIAKFNFENRGKGNKKDKKEKKKHGDEDEEEEDDEDEDEDEDEDNDNDDDGDEDEDDDDNKGRGSQGRTKILICHKDSHTLKVAKAAARAHISHGDVLGACGEDDDSDDDDDTATTIPDTIAPVISNVSLLEGTTTAEIMWNTDEIANSKIWYTPISPVDITIDPFESSNIFVIDHTIVLSGLTASTTYYIVVASEDESGNTATSSEQSFTTLSEIVEDPVDTTIPIITTISILNATTSADITWDTDEGASSKVWYGTVSPVDLNTASFVSSETLMTSHSVALTSLSASTTYYIIVSSTDESGNKATSSEQSFTTLSDVLPVPDDITPPVISDVTATSTIATSTTVLWTTDEDATSVVWYATSTPVTIIPETLSVTNTTFTTSHSLELTGLIASSTYYYLVSSTDENDNTATSTEHSFLTLP